MKFSDRIAADAALIAADLDTVIGDQGDLPLHQAMRYAVAGGKRLRGFLVMEGARLHEVPEDNALSVACAVEALHAYSLVHDDLPAMDNDDLRRGLPTVHVKWNEATAILAGDALQTLAFSLLAHSRTGSQDVRIDLIAELAQASGAVGMVEGQARDIAAETTTTPLNLSQILRLQSLKTGALIRFSAIAGPVMARANFHPLSAYATALGLAFQIADDILDVTGDAATTGKRVGKDAAASKATFVSLLGLDGAKARAQDLVDEACAALAPYGGKADVLKEAARFVIARDK